MRETIKRTGHMAPNHIAVIRNSTVPESMMKDKSLMIISDAGWKIAVDEKFSWLKDIPSTLIISDKSRVNY